MDLNTIPYEKSEMCALAQYVRTEIYEPWKRIRKEKLELKWQRNIDGFNSISTGFWKKQEGEDWRSDTFIPLIKLKCLAAWSMIVDMLLQGGRIPFMLTASPYDEINLEELPEAEQEVIKDAIDDMEQIIHQQLSDCHADRALMMNVMSGAIYGETYAKRAIQEVVRPYFRQVQFADGTLDFIPDQKRNLSPTWEYVSVWDIYRDWETDNLKEGKGVIQRQLISPYDLRQKIEDPFFIEENIEKAIKQATKPGDSKVGEVKESLTPGLRDISHRQKTIENLEFWGRVPQSVVEKFERNLGLVEPGLETYTDDDRHLGKEIEVHLQMADAEIVRFVRTTPDDRPFYRSVFEIKLDHLESTGIADNVEKLNQVLNGFVRAFEDNKKLSGNVIIATNRSAFQPGATKEITPGKQLHLRDSIDDARKAFQPIIIPDVGESLLSGIGIFQQFADEASLIPKLVQGFVHEKQKPDTAYELSQLLENAGKYLGGVLKNQDEGLIEPIVTDFYRYNMIDPKLTRGKGNFIAKPLGFSSFQNRVTRITKLLQFLNLSLSHDSLAQETNFRHIQEELAKALDIDPSQVLKSPKEKEATQEALAQQQAILMQMQALEAALKEAQTKKAEAEAILTLEKKRTEEVEQEKTLAEIEQQELGFGKQGAA